MSVLILGIGNPWASDDGVGPEVVARARRQWQLEGRAKPPAVEFRTLAQPDLGLLDLLAGYESLILVDAVVSGAAPGTLHRQVWAPGALADRGIERASSHGFGVRELLEMAAALGRLPARVELWGIEIISTEPGAGLSPLVAAAAPEIIESLVQALADLTSAAPAQCI